MQKVILVSQNPPTLPYMSLMRGAGGSAGRETAPFPGGVEKHRILVVNVLCIVRPSIKKLPRKGPHTGPSSTRSRSVANKPELLTPVVFFTKNNSHLPALNGFKSKIHLN